MRTFGEVPVNQIFQNSEFFGLDTNKVNWVNYSLRKNIIETKDSYVNLWDSLTIHSTYYDIQSIKKTTSPKQKNAPNMILNVNYLFFNINIFSFAYIFN